MAKEPLFLHAARSVFSCFKSCGCRLQRCIKPMEMLSLHFQYKDPVYVVMDYFKDCRKQPNTESLVNSCASRAGTKKDSP